MGIKSKRPAFTFDDSSVKTLLEVLRESPQITRALDLKFVQQRHDWAAHLSDYAPALWRCKRCGVGYFGNPAQWLGECRATAEARSARVEGEGT